MDEAPAVAFGWFQWEFQCSAAALSLDGCVATHNTTPTEEKNTTRKRPAEEPQRRKQQRRTTGSVEAARQVDTFSETHSARCSSCCIKRKPKQTAAELRNTRRRVRAAASSLHNALLHLFMRSSPRQGRRAASSAANESIRALARKHCQRHADVDASKATRCFHAGHGGGR